jgi:hypothetical protein
VNLVVKSYVSMFMYNKICDFFGSTVMAPCRLSPPSLAVADGTDTGTSMAFVGGWFEFKSGYLNVYH